MSSDEKPQGEGGKLLADLREAKAEQDELLLKDELLTPRQRVELELGKLMPLTFERLAQILSMQSDKEGVIKAQAQIAMELIREAKQLAGKRNPAQQSSRILTSLHQNAVSEELSRRFARREHEERRRAASALPIIVDDDSQENKRGGG